MSESASHSHATVDAVAGLMFSLVLRCSGWDARPVLNSCSTFILWLVNGWTTEKTAATHIPTEKFDVLNHSIWVRCVSKLGDIMWHLKILYFVRKPIWFFKVHHEHHDLVSLQSPRTQKAVVPCILLLLERFVISSLLEVLQKSMPWTNKIRVLYILLEMHQWLKLFWNIRISISSMWLGSSRNFGTFCK